MTVSANERVVADEQARDWRKRKLKFVSSVRTSNVDKHIVEGEAAVRLCNYTDVYYHEEITPDMPFMQGSATEGEIERFGLKKGQVLLTKDSESWEDIAVPAYVSETMPEVVCGYHLAVIETDSDEVDGRYLSWLAQSPVLNDQFKLSAKGVTRFGLSQHALKNAVIDAPPLEYQLKVAAFLDRKTAEIDTLIAKKRRLLDRLVEKRTALITRAVTKGLNPDAPMKDSGIEWLGEIPAHWDVIAIKWITPVLRGASPRPIDDPIYFDDEGEYSWVRIADVTASEMRLEKTTQRLSELGASLSVKRHPGDLFLSIAGSVGKPIIAGIKCCIHDGFVYFPRIPPELSEYLFWIFKSGQPYLGLGKLGTQLNLNTDTVGGIRIALPPADEVHEIVDWISDSVESLDEIHERISNAIARLEEYRSALITNAVTGQIKVA